MDISTLAGLISFLGTNAFLGFVKSQLLEGIPWFGKQDANTKSAIVLVASVVFGLLSYALSKYVPQSELTQLQPLYNVIFSSVTVWLSSQAYHNMTKAPPATPPGTQG